jgi:hypothetical protein
MARNADFSIGSSVDPSALATFSQHGSIVVISQNELVFAGGNFVLLDVI